MKFLHLSDLHLGINLNSYSLIDDQKFILDVIIRSVEKNKPDAVIIAGDIYDKAIPPAEAVALFDGFITKLSGIAGSVFVISGNHDSAERIGFGSAIMARSGVYFSPVYTGSLEPVSLADEFGEIDFWLIPFLRPSEIRRFFPDENAENMDAAFKTAVSHLDIDESRRNIIIAHQAVTGAELGGSEHVPVGGLDFIGADAFAKFDYTALGHIHRPQNITPNIRYCGTPLKYSLSEVSGVKSLSFTTLGRKGDPPVIDEIPLTPLHDMRSICGTFAELTAPSFCTDSEKEDYTYITLTDDVPVMDAFNRLREIYPRIMDLKYDNKSTRSAFQVKAVQRGSPIETFENFYSECSGCGLSDEQRGYLGKIISEIWEE